MKGRFKPKVMNIDGCERIVAEGGGRMKDDRRPVGSGNEKGKEGSPLTFIFNIDYMCYFLLLLAIRSTRS